MMQLAENLKAETLAVNHAELKRFSDNSDYRSCCPHEDCAGVLGVNRDPDGGQLLEYDRCTLCAQSVVYMDIEKMREELG